MPDSQSTSKFEVKRNGRGRLHDPAGCRYVRPTQLRRYVEAGIAVTVTEAATGEDVTRVLLS